jgi:adenylate cyclase
LHPDDALALSRGAISLILVGDVDQGLEWAERAYALNSRVCAYNVACAHALAGDGERALDLLESDAASTAVYRNWLEHDSDWDSLREHPRFKAVLETLP